MSDFKKLPEEDFMYDKVDFNFLVELNMLLHFIRLAQARLKANQSNHRICEVFIIFKNLINTHLPSLNEKIISTEKSQAELEDVFKNNRKMIAEAVEKEIQKKNKEDLAKK